VYFGRRYYAPNIGRWITPDPIGFNDGPNLYAYVHNNPLTAIDLYGLTTVDHRETSWHKEQKKSKSEPNRDKTQKSENRYSKDKDSKTTGLGFSSNLSTENLLDMYDDDFFDRELVRNYRDYSSGIVAGAVVLGTSALAYHFGSLIPSALVRSCGFQLAHSSLKYVYKKGLRVFSDSFNVIRKINRVKEQYAKPSESNKIQDLERAISDWLGPETKLLHNKAKDPIFLSNDGTKRVRFDFNNPHGDYPHLHIEEKINIKWKDATKLHRIYPKDLK
jgi:hypothetical protein